VIIGNPPFLGGNKIRQGLGDGKIDDLFELYKDRVPATADLVCYWFERARTLIATGQAKRVGLLATQAIRGGANRKVLERIKNTGDIFWAQSDRNWILDGATVHVSMVGFDDGTEQDRTLDGKAVTTINSDLTTSHDLTAAKRLRENLGLCLRPPEKGGSFDISGELARSMLAEPINVNGRPNSDVIHPWVNGSDIVRSSRNMWIIDFGEMSEEDAALYEAPFAYVKQHVFPERQKSNEQRTRMKWWLHRRSGGDMQAALTNLARYIATTRVAKHRIFVWVNAETTPDDSIYVFARDDDYFFGVLQSKLHELWARGTGTQLREAESGFRYTPTSTFETFPFPWPPGQEPADDSRVGAIAAAARDLVAKRDAWLHPPAAPPEDLKKRTLTNLYNARPTWLAQAHTRLDAAVLAAYGWPADLPDAAILERLLALNAARAGGA
jgi:type II restriction/modification system DNA methylase subunit YeeA